MVFLDVEFDDRLWVFCSLASFCCGFVVWPVCRLFAVCLFGCFLLAAFGQALMQLVQVLAYRHSAGLASLANFAGLASLFWLCRSVCCVQFCCSLVFGLF